MDRIATIDQSRINFWRGDLVAEAANGNDDDLTERIDANGAPTTDESGLLVDRKDREHVAYYQDENGNWLPSALKRDDDIIICGCEMRVVGPARGRAWVSVYNYDLLGEDGVYVMPVIEVSDRAPADSGETPMPIIPEPALQFMRASGGAANPKDAAKAERAEQRDDRRMALDVVSAQLTHEKQRNLRRVFKQRGLLGKGDDA